MRGAMTGRGEAQGGFIVRVKQCLRCQLCMTVSLVSRLQGPKRRLSSGAYRAVRKIPTTLLAVVAAAQREFAEHPAKGSTYSLGLQLNQDNELRLLMEPKLQAVKICQSCKAPSVEHGPSWYRHLETSSPSMGADLAKLRVTSVSGTPKHAFCESGEAARM